MSARLHWLRRGPAMIAYLAYALVFAIRRDEAPQTWTFTISNGNTEFRARYQGVPPDLFTVTREVIAEGRMGTDGFFEIRTLLATHPTEYKQRGREGS